MADIQRDIANQERKYRLKSVSNLIGGKIILAKYEGDQRWYRGVVRSLLDREQVTCHDLKMIVTDSKFLTEVFPQMAEVQFIDYGDINIVPIEHLLELKYFPSALSAIPPQVR